MRIAIFGTVGAGKTTLIENLLKLLPKDYEIFLEPMEENPYFKDLYTNTNDDMQTLTYKMELWMLASRMKQLKKSLTMKNVLFDRGVVDTLIFADANHKLNKISDRDYHVFEEYFNSCIMPTIFNKKDNLYDLMIYLKVSDETSIRHIQQRGIKEEQLVDHSFWKLLNKNYDYWYSQWKSFVPFYVIDGNNDDSEQLAEKIMSDLKLNNYIELEEKSLIRH